MRKLPIARGKYPVPWFVAEINGEYDFRVIGPGKIDKALLFKLCWVCGEPLGGFKAFTIGPMCSVNRISAEPPSHRDCAIFSARYCPFLSQPQMERRKTKLPPAKDPAGIMLERNPGATLVWVTKSFEIRKDWRTDGILFHIGDPTEVLWFAKGREATRDEVLESINSGLPTLQEMAEQDGPRAVEHLTRQTEAAMKLVPA